MFDRTFAAVLLDMDGTLVSSTAGVERSWTRWAVEHGVPVPDFATVHGATADDLVARLLAGRPPEVLAAARRRIDEIELSEAGPVVVLPGAREALEVLVAAGRCALVTSAARALVRARFEGVGLPVPPMVTADDVTRGKPAPDPYLAGAALLGVDPVDCLVVEDTPIGVRSGRAAGATTLGLRTTTPDPGADAVVDDLSEVQITVDEGDVRVSARSFHPLPGDPIAVQP